jgi:hypothetical protein
LSPDFICRESKKLDFFKPVFGFQNLSKPVKTGRLALWNNLFFWVYEIKSVFLNLFIFLLKEKETMDIGYVMLATMNMLKYCGK